MKTLYVVEFSCIKAVYLDDKLIAVTKNTIYYDNHDSRSVNEVLHALGYEVKFVARIGTFYEDLHEDIPRDQYREWVPHKSLSEFMEVWKKIRLRKKDREIRDIKKQLDALEKERGEIEQG